MMKSFLSLFSPVGRGGGADAPPHPRGAVATEKDSRLRLIMVWGVILVLGPAFLLLGTDTSLATLGLYGLYLCLVVGISSRLWRQEELRVREAWQALAARDTANRLASLHQAFLTLDLDTLLQQIVDEMARLIPCRGAGLILRHRRQDGTERIVTTGRFPVSLAAEIEGSLTKGALNDVLNHGAAVLHSPQDIQARFHSLPIKEAVQKNLLIVRLRRQQISGFLLLTDKRGDEGFHDGDAQMLTAVAKQAAVAIENARLFAEARKAEGEQRGLVRALLSAQEQERKRVVNEWHDRLGAKLFDVLQGFRSCQELIMQRVPEGKERFEKLTAEIDAMAAMVRGFTNELHPSVLEDFGFVAALHDYVAGLREQEPFRVTVQAEAVDHQLPSEANLTLFRIMQEALLNVHKHAQARHVQIAFVQEHSGVSLMIKDDGQGFNPEQPPQGHYGLLYMRERAESCGGTFRVISTRGQGTEVRVDFPGGGRAAVKLPPRASSV